VRRGWPSAYIELRERAENCGQKAFVVTQQHRNLGGSLTPLGLNVDSLGKDESDSGTVRAQRGSARSKEILMSSSKAPASSKRTPSANKPPSLTSKKDSRANSDADVRNGLGVVVGEGGETHQVAGPSGPVLTTNHGVAVSDNQNSLRAGDRGPTLLEDFVLREKIFHFDHERIPERIVHARGSGAHGYFECTAAIPELTKASIFQEIGAHVPLFARFSTVAGGAGSADTPRDVRGFAVKFYTQEGNWDLVGNNIPVFFIQDAIKFPDLIHAVKMEADRGYPQAASAHDTFWDFAGLMPESTHMLMWAMSDRTLPRSLRMMEGFGVHTFQLVNAEGVAKFVKFHWRPVQGVQSTLWDEAVKIAGADSDFHRRDLHDAIEAGDFPAWDLAIQVFDEDFANSQPYDVLDATKLIPEEDIPLRVIGRMTLDRNPDNFFAETEQVAFLPSNIVPGIDFSNDPLLQGRLFSYLDTQHSRLGTTNFHQIPINQPKCPYANFQRDGHMQTVVPTGRANYEPNSIGDNATEVGPRESPQHGFVTVGDTGNASLITPQPVPAARTDSELVFGLGGNVSTSAKSRMRADRFGDHYSQATMFWISQSESEQAHIASSFVFELSKLTLPHVVERILANLGNVSTELTARIAKGLGQCTPDTSHPARPAFQVAPSAALSIQANSTPTLKGRKVGVLVADGSDGTLLADLMSSLKREGATVMTIAPKRTVAIGGKSVTVDGQLAGSPSCLLDAVALVLNDESVAMLAAESAAVQFVQDTFGHLKAIGATTACQPLLDRAGVVNDAGVTGLEPNLKAFITVAATRQWNRESNVRMLA
jgi:catalase